MQNGSFNLETPINLQFLKFLFDNKTKVILELYKDHEPTKMSL